MEYAGVMASEVGKTRMEALGEVEEVADLIRYYAKTAEDNAYYDHEMDNLGDPAVHTRSILRRHGVFAVISPFNFPMALSRRARRRRPSWPATPSCSSRPRSRPSPGVILAEVYRDAGVPDGVFNLVMGPGSTVGEELQENPGIDGIVFTGSYDVGFDIFRSFLKHLSAPVHRGDGRQEHRGRARQRRPRGGGRGDHARGVRVWRAEVLGEQPRLRPAAGPRRAGATARRQDRAAGRRQPRRSPPRSSVRSSTSTRWIATSRPWPRPGATERCSPGAIA